MEMTSKEHRLDSKQFPGGFVLYHLLSQLEPQTEVPAWLPASSLARAGIAFEDLPSLSKRHATLFSLVKTDRCVIGCN